MPDQDLYALIQQMAENDPDALQKMIDAVMAPEQMGVAQQQLGMGHEMFNTPQPQGREVGRTYVASSPMEHVAAALRSGVGAHMANQAMQNEQDLIKRKGTGLLAYLRGLSGYGNAQPPSAGDSRLSGLGDWVDYGSGNS